MKRTISVILSALALFTPGVAMAGNWISELPDDVCIREMSIPGAHDAATGNGFAPGSAFLAAFSGITQTLSIDGQWDSGVRAFDLRPSYKSGVDGDLQIYHGILETNLSMKAAIDMIVAKLTENPGEFAIVMMRHEDESDNHSDAWSGAMSALINSYGDYIVKFAPRITVGDARGKIIVLSRDTFDSSTVGFISGVTHDENFSNQCGGSIAIGRTHVKLFSQDFYDCKTSERKIAAVNAMLEYSSANTTANNWIINNISGYVGSTGTNSNIVSLAVDAIPAFIEKLDGLAVDGRTGIVLLDFAGAAKSGTRNVRGDEAVDRIIAQNSKYIAGAGIDTPIADSIVTDSDPVYTPAGRYIGRYGDVNASLGRGIYIVGSRKMILGN